MEGDFNSSINSDYPLSALRETLHHPRAEDELRKCIQRMICRERNYDHTSYGGVSDFDLDMDVDVTNDFDIPDICNDEASQATDELHMNKDEPRFHSDEVEVQDDGNFCDDCEIRCEFSNPCAMGPSPDGMHFRKVVSHVFGRNKSSTKLFPMHIWVHYCRKHYQRARYRADKWPFTQCELLLESLQRIEEWGGVDSFELSLRRRERIRVDDGYGSHSTTATSSAKKTRGRKNPKPVNAPVPMWLQQEVGGGKSFDQIRTIIRNISSHMTDLLDAEKVHKKAAKAAARMSFNYRKKRNGKQFRQDASHIRFPDIEILPIFKTWVKEHAALQKDDEKTTLVSAGSTRIHETVNCFSDEQDDGDSEQSSGGANATGTDESASHRLKKCKSLTRVSPRGAVQKPKSKAKKN